MGKKNILKKSKETESFWVGLRKDFIFVLAIIVIFVAVSKIAMGLYTPMVAVESGSMIPHIQIGDIIFVQSIDRTEIITYQTGKQTNYSSFSEFGDVILYKRLGIEEGHLSFIVPCTTSTRVSRCGREDLRLRMQDILQKVIIAELMLHMTSKAV